MARFISIVSGGESCGKTTVALNLGIALHLHGKKVVVFDADFSKPNITTHLDMKHLPITIEDAFKDKNTIQDAIYKHVSGLRIIPSLTLNDYSKLHEHLPELFTTYDFVIVDTPLDSAFAENLLKFSHEAIIVHNPLYSSKTVLDMSKLLKKNKVLNLGIVLNKSHKDSVDVIFEIPVIAKLDNSKHITKSFELKNPVLYTHPRSPAAKEFLNLAKKLMLD